MPIPLKPREGHQRCLISNYVSRAAIVGIVERETNSISPAIPKSRKRSRHAAKRVINEAARIRDPQD